MTASLFDRATAALYSSDSSARRESGGGANFQRLEQNGKTLYGNTFSQAIDSFHSRFEARHRDDREAVAQSRAARAQHEAFFRRVGMDPKDATLGLGTLHEFETLPRDPEKIQPKIAANTFEALRMSLGSTEEANAAVANHNKFMAAYAEAVPFFAHRARANGAHVSEEIVRLGAQYGAKLK
jgi:hypothetical protein